MNYFTLSSIYLLTITEQLVRYECRETHSAIDEGKVPGPFAKDLYNILLYSLGIFIVIIVVMMCCCLCWCFCLRKPQDEVLEVSPSDLVAIGATPSYLRAANITPSALKESGATYDEMAKLGATPSQLVEQGADKETLVRLGATKSQIERAGLRDGNKRSPQKKAVSTSPPTSELQKPMISEVKKPVERSVAPKEISRQTEDKPTEEVTSTRMSELTKTIGEKLKDGHKSKKSFAGKETESVSPKSSYAPSKKDDTNGAQNPNLSRYSTASVSPAKKAEALKPTDDSMSVAMGPTN